MRPQRPKWPITAQMADSPSGFPGPTYPLPPIVTGKQLVLQPKLYFGNQNVFVEGPLHVGVIVPSGEKACRPIGCVLARPRIIRGRLQHVSRADAISDVPGTRLYRSPQSRTCSRCHSRCICTNAAHLWLRPLHAGQSIPMRSGGTGSFKGWAYDGDGGASAHLSEMSSVLAGTCAQTETDGSVRSGTRRRSRMAYIILLVVGPFGVTRRDLNAARSVPLLVRKLISVVYININMFTCASRLFTHGG
jgi:hypothetical protein